MEAKYIGIAFLILAILLLLLGIVLVTVRIEKCKRKVRQMAMTEKVQILNELAEPFGFFYQRKEDVFTSQLDAWQRKQGYMALYDKAAASAGMVIDAWPTLIMRDEHGLSNSGRDSTASIPVERLEFIMRMRSYLLIFTALRIMMRQKIVKCLRYIATLRKKGKKSMNYAPTIGG